MVLCRRSIAGILEDAHAKLSGTLHMLLAQLKLELDHLDMRIDEWEKERRAPSWPGVIHSN
jgi:hypothetical protein